MSARQYVVSSEMAEAIAILNRHAWSQKEIARLFGVTGSTVWNVLHGTRKMPYRKAGKDLADLLRGIAERIEQQATN